MGEIVVALQNAGVGTQVLAERRGATLRGAYDEEVGLPLRTMNSGAVHAPL